MLKLGKYSFGMGDRFARQGVAQLRACQFAREHGINIVPVWNKSNREHLTVGSEPQSVRAEADAAVRELGWTREYRVDADHINLSTVGRFIAPSDFFTIDVASSIGKAAESTAVEAFLKRHPELTQPIDVPGLERPLSLSGDEIARIAAKYLLAIEEAGKIYRHIANEKGAENFITEVSMDETDTPQTPPELLVILAAMADCGIPLQTIAPKFTGRFNKGVDYVGNLQQFEREFQDDLAVIAFATQRYGLPENLKLSVHSGSDKFSIYPAIRRSIRRSPNGGAGLHIKTAGTTWLEELIGLAEAGGAGLDLAREIYAEALEHADELCAPYAAVIDINREKLPSEAQVDRWSAAQYVNALRHDPSNPEFNPDLRQLLHVAYKIAAKKGARYLDALREFESAVSRNVTLNLWERHLKPIFMAKD